MDVSVIIPTYKPDNYIFDCLDSICGQTLERDSYEVLVVLNGCDDPYRSMVEDYAGKHSETSIRVLHTDKKGVSAARNMGIDSSKGDYVCFIDDDDWISPSFLATLLSKGSRAVIPVSNCIMKDSEGNQKPHFLTIAYSKNEKKNNPGIFSLRSFYSSVCGKLIPTCLIGSIRFNENFALGEDSLFMFDISYKVKEMVLAPADAVYYIRQRENSASRKSIHYSQKSKILTGLICSYCKAWLRHPFSYNFLFFISRLVATASKFLIRNYR